MELSFVGNGIKHRRLIFNGTLDRSEIIGSFNSDSILLMGYMMHLVILLFFILFMYEVLGIHLPHKKYLLFLLFL